jgi:hypothetical protein
MFFVPRWVAQFSGGIGSWAAARRFADANGTEGGVLLFADTRIEDMDLYRFLVQAAADIGCPLVSIADGRTPWQVYEDERFLGNSQRAPCSKILKQQICRAWLRANCHDETPIIVGIDYSQKDRPRLDGIVAAWRPYHVVAPLVDAKIFKEQLIAELESRGIKRPRMYDEGFSQNNCGGFCCRAGHAHFRHLLKTRPEVYADAEEREQHVRDFLGKDVSILSDRSGGTKTPLTLAAFRQRVESDPQEDLFEEWGACACFTSE